VGKGATTTNKLLVKSNLGVGQMTDATTTLSVWGNSWFFGNATTTGRFTVGDDGGTGTTTLSIQTDGTSGSCFEYVDTEGVLGHFYFRGTTQVIEAGACK
jgi:hypothetical protein